MYTVMGIRRLATIITLLALTLSGAMFTAAQSTTAQSTAAQNEMFAVTSDQKANTLSIYSKGLVSKNVVSINGVANSVFASAHVHGNNGFSMKGTLKHVLACIQRDENGLCLGLEDAVEPWKQFSGALNQSSYICDTNASTLLCNRNAPKFLIDNPFNPWDINGSIKANDAMSPVINPEAAAIFSMYAAGYVSGETLQALGYISANTSTLNFGLHEIADTNGDGVFNYDANYGATDSPTDLSVVIRHMCQTSESTFMSASDLSSRLRDPSFAAGRTICTLGNVSIPSSVNLQGMNLILMNGSRLDFNGEAMIEDSIIILADGNLGLKGGMIKDSVIYTGGSMEIAKNVSIQGVTSLLTGGHMSFLGSTTVANDQDGPFIGLSVISNGNIQFNGSSDTYGIYQTRGSYRQNGHSSIYGTVLAGQDILMNGGIEINTTLPVFNPTLTASSISGSASQ